MDVKVIVQRNGLSWLGMESKGALKWGIDYHMYISVCTNALISPSDK
jgi:hypothetical protein